MLDGMWIVQYEGVQGNGGGVVVFVNGKVLGGDTGFTYIGTYNLNNGEVNAKVRVSNFLPDVKSVLGIEGDFDLFISGKLTGDTLSASGSVIGAPGAVALKLTKCATL